MATEAEILAAIAEADRVLAAGPPAASDHRALFPDLARRHRADAPAPAIAGHGAPARQAQHARPTQAAAEVTLAPEQVAAWSAELGFTASPSAGRVSRAGD